MGTNSQLSQTNPSFKPDTPAAEQQATQSRPERGEAERRTDDRPASIRYLGRFVVPFWP